MSLWRGSDLDFTPIMENQMEKSMGNDTKTTIIELYLGFRVSKVESRVQDCGEYLYLLYCAFFQQGGLRWLTFWGGGGVVRV